MARYQINAEYIEDNVTIVVISAPEYCDRQNVIRDTYTNLLLKNQCNFNVIFALGSNFNQNVQAMTIGENEKYSDIVQCRFHDSYKNVTNKTFAIFN